MVIQSGILDEVKMTVWSILNTRNMAKFNKGDEVVHALSPDRKGFIIDICPPRRGPQLYKVMFAGEMAPVDISEMQLKPSFNVSDPYQRCEQNIFGNFVEFSRINTAFKISNSNNSTISSLKASKTLFRAYQFKPLLKFLNSDNRRLLVADEVGLGKTIEAGHIMLELKARNELKNVLIVCPNSLKQKWQTELADKFGLTFDIVEDNKQFLQLLKMHDGHIRAIVNYEKIRLPKVKPAEEIENKRETNVLEFIKKENKQFSLILCDEAHKLRNKDNLWYKGAEVLMQHCSAAVFLTATPIMISEDNLYNLMHLLNEELYDNKANFLNALSVNRPFVRAQSDIRGGMPLTVVADYLKNSEVSTSYAIGDDIVAQSCTLWDSFNEFPIYRRIIERLADESDSKKLRAEILADLEEMSPLSGTFSRTRKRDVITDMSQAERRPKLISVKLSEEEQAIFDNVILEYEITNSYKPGASLALTTKKRQVASSVWAYKNVMDDPLFDDKGKASPNFQNLNNGIDLFEDCRDSKIEKLDEVIKEVFKNGIRKIVIFAIFTHTIMYLKIRLSQLGYNCAVIYGGNVADRDAEIKRFRFDPTVNVLLSTEVGSEGLDMQFCNSLVNYDLPWNPMVVEQRIGRIDRFGQKSPVVNIYNFVIKGSIQEIIYERLLERIGIFHGSIGDMEAILDAEVERNGRPVRIQELYERAETELYCTQLTEEERNKKIEEIAQAFETEKQNLKQIEEGLTNALTNDAYFKEQVDRMLKNNSYVTEYELKNFVEMMRLEELPYCQISESGNEIYDWIMPLSNTRAMSSFLTQYQPVGQEYNVLFQQFKNKIIDQNRFSITFNQDVAYNSEKAMFVNIYHPIVIASLEFFKKKHKDDVEKCTFEFNLPRIYLSKPLDTNAVFLAVYQIDESREVYGQVKKSSTLYPIIYNVSANGIIDDPDFSEEFLGEVFIGGQNLLAPTKKNFDRSFYNELRGSIKDAIDLKISSQFEETSIRIENDRKKREQFVKQNHEVHLKRLTNRYERIVQDLDFYLSMNYDEMLESLNIQKRLLSGQINTLNDQLKAQLDVINKDQKLNVVEKLLSLNLINLI